MEQPEDEHGEENDEWMGDGADDIAEKATWMERDHAMEVSGTIYIYQVGWELGALNK